MRFLRMEVIDFTTEHLEKLKEHEVKIENNMKEIKGLEHRVDDISELKENIKVLTYIQKEQNLFNKGAPFAQLYTDLMNKQKYDLLVRLIQSIKFKLPLYEYEELIDFFMMDLKNKSTLNELQVEDYVKQLKAEDDFNFFV